MATKRYKFVGTQPMHFPLAGDLEPNDEFELDADVDFRHVDVRVRSGSSWAETYVEDAPAPKPAKPRARKAKKASGVAPARENVVSIESPASPASAPEGDA